VAKGPLYIGRTARREMGAVRTTENHSKANYMHKLMGIEPL